MSEEQTIQSELTAAFPFLADQVRVQRVRRIVAFVHHLPFADLVPPGRPARFAFAAAYMGSNVLGSVLLGCPAVTDVYCGHSHWRGRRTIGHVNVVNIGSTAGHQVYQAGNVYNATKFAVKALTEGMTADTLILRIMQRIPSPEKPLEAHVRIAAGS